MPWWAWLVVGLAVGGFAGGFVGAVAAVLYIGSGMRW